MKIIKILNGNTKTNKNFLKNKNQKGIKDELVEKGGLILKRIIDNEEGYEEKMFNANKNWWHFWKKYKKTSKYYARKN